MFYKTSFVLLVALVVATTGRAQTFVTGSETVNQGAPGFGGSGSTPFIIRAVGTSLGGYEFANDITNTAPTAGDLINIVNVDNFTQFNSSTGTATRNNSPNFITVVTATQAKIQSVASGGAQVTLLTSGQFGLYSTASLNVQHPATWGATNGAGTTFNTPLALYSLNTTPPPGGIVPGLAANGLPAEGDIIPQNLVNVQSVNLVLGLLNQGNALFNEVNNGGYLVIDPILSNTVGQLGLVQEQLNGGVLPVLTAADMAAMNTIFTNLDPGHGPFATFGSGGTTDFTPNFAGGTADSEFTSNINIDPLSLSPVTIGVPEPATLSLWGLLLGSGGIGGVIRRYRSKWARKA